MRPPNAPRLGAALFGVTIVALGVALAPRGMTHALPLAVDAAPAVAVAGAPSGAVADEAARVEQDIALYAAAARRDPASAYYPTRLAALYMRRGRRTASYADFTRAEREARRALGARTQHNGAAFELLVSSLLAQHRFAEAGRVARQLVAGNPEVAVYRAMLGEVELELGNYDAAGTAFDSVGLERRSLSIAPRIARWAEIRGDTTSARAALYRAADQAHVEGWVQGGELAWFDLRVGDYELRHGALGSAERALQRGLAAAPEDYRLLAALAHLHAVRHDWPRAIDYGERAIAVSLDPATLGLLSDAYAASGDSAQAGEYARTMEVAVRRQPGAFHRAWSLFLLDRRRRVAEVEANVRAELRARHDVYGHDLLGWALYQRGRYAEARREMTAATAQGTQDALLFYHAGMVERALGDRAAADTLLRRALAVNPYFDAAHPAQVRATLDSVAHGQ